MRSAMKRPPDQATGLRRLFAARAGQQLIAVAANPFVSGSGALLECAVAALVARERQVLLVDAAATSPAANELARIDVAAGIEPLSAQVSYLAARGLPLAHVDTSGSAASFLDAVCAAAPNSDAIVVHADVGELARMLKRRAVRPLLLGADHPDAIKHAYACCKLLVQRCGLMTFDLLLAAHPGRRRVRAIAHSLGDCADTFLGALLHDWAAVEPVLDLGAAHDDALQRLIAAQLALDPTAEPIPSAATHAAPTFARPAATGA